MTWTKKHQQFALLCSLRPSTIHLLMWIMRRVKPYEMQNLEIDLTLFNDWVKKFRGRGYDRKTLKFALAQIDECTNGLVLTEKSYTWAIHRLIVRPLSFALAQNNQNLGKSPKLATGNPMFDAEHKKNAYKQQQQNISRLDSLFRKIGMKYSKDALVRIWRLANKNYDDVVDAVQLLLHRHSTQAEPIPNPYGWLIKCLEIGWHLDSELINSPKLPVYDSISQLVEDCNRLRKIPIPST